MAKADGAIEAVNALWSVDPRGAKTWHAKFRGTEKEFPRGTVLLVDLLIKKNNQTDRGVEVIVVDYLAKDFSWKEPVVFAAFTADLSDEEIERIKTGKSPTKKGRKQTGATAKESADLEQIKKVVEENNFLLNAILECLNIEVDTDGKKDDEVPF